jgi:nucleotide-binding universal stress UspA family protein/hemerythrin-like domain-containing protein
MYKHLLVPTDGSELSNQTIGNAIAFAKDAGASITFFYAAPDYLATSEGVLMLSVAPSIVSDNIAGDAHAVLMKAEAAARNAGVAYKSVYKISDRPHEAIVEAAEKQACDLIYMASRGPKSVGGLLLGSVTLKVLMHSRIPVLVSSVMRNSATPEMNQAIGIIQDEHRSQAAVLHAMRQILVTAREQDEEPDLTVLGQLLFYIREFPEKLHHPKEDTYLFSKLRERTRTVDDALVTLEAQHADHAAFEALEVAWQILQKEGKAGIEGFSKALENFAASQWQHMKLEEYVILPAAKEHLLPADWVEIAEAFGKNGDPRFGAEPAGEFSAMFAKLARLTQSLNNA